MNYALIFVVITLAFMRKWFIVITLSLAVIAVIVFFFIKNGGDLSHMIGKDISEGVIEYDITYPKINPNSMMLQGMPNKAYLRFKNNDMVNDMSGMMGLISIVYIAKQSPQSVMQTLTLINKKYASDISLEEMNKINGDYVTKIEKGKNTKEIAGYKCKEAIVTLYNGDQVNVFYTKDIAIKNPNWSNPYNQIEGVLMDFQMERYGLIMHLKAKQVTAQPIDDSAFTITDEYQKVSFAELDKMLMELNPSGD